MDDLEFYKTALRIQSNALSFIAQVPAYNGHWSPELSVKEILKTFGWIKQGDGHYELFKMENLTKERALSIGFSYWDKKNMPDFLLFPLWYAILFIPYGTKVINIFGNEEEFKPETDLDHIYGCVGFGMNFKE